jgi:hypothetical protein
VCGVAEKALDSEFLKKTGISYTQQKVGRIIGLLTSCVGTAFRITLLKEG